MSLKIKDTTPCYKFIDASRAKEKVINKNLRRGYYCDEK